MKITIMMILALVGFVSAYHPYQSESVSEYNFKTIHEIPDKKLDDELEAKLAGLNKMLHDYQIERKTEVNVKSEVQEKEDVSQDKAHSYEFGYGVKDPKTGDSKDQWEKRVGGKVKGVYKFAESDGTQRIVEYEADDKKGFEAKVINVAPEEGKEKTKEVGKEEGEAAKSYSYLKKYFH
ncbi:uncharacterized protein LOC134209390 [Armigeres subalbatus]|uniref:uncharacterized protein LOC134209390 n=1 Tax=Armigeres subalbatus TaxID=124917 RepID=UPI002ED54001